MGDEEQFRVLVLTHAARLHRIAVRICGPGAAQDAVQTACEKAFASWARVSRADDPAAYLCRIVVNESLREARRSSQLSLREEVWQAPSAPTDRIEDRLDLGRLLGVLPPKQRAVVVLRFLEDQRVAAVARTLGISEGTVKRQSFDAVRTLRRAMTADAGPAAAFGAVATAGPARGAGAMTTGAVRDV